MGKNNENSDLVCEKYKRPTRHLYIHEGKTSEASSPLYLYEMVAKLVRPAVIKNKLNARPLSVFEDRFRFQGLFWKSKPLTTR